MQSNTIHKLADVQSPNIGEGTVVWQFCVILAGAEIGKRCNINALTFIENDVVLGDDVTIKSGVQIWDGIRISDSVFIGPNVTFTNDFLPRSKARPAEFLQSNIEHNASIGANSTLIGGITIGSYAMVGAGSVVTKSVPSYALVYGNPARKVGYVCRCGNKLSSDYLCRVCGLSYKMQDNILDIVL